MPSEPPTSQDPLGDTIEACIAALLGGAAFPALGRTLVDHPEVTLRPTERVSTASRGFVAVEALRSLGASMHGKIELHRTLGEGGMGIVHLATQATLGRHVAVKTLRSGAASDEATLRILREAWVTGALEHPNVVPIYDVGVDSAGSPVILMKRIEGQEWAELLHSHAAIHARFPTVDPLDWNLQILGSVCNAVHFAHSRGILHRDLKPENVMIGLFGEVYVLDWGIAVSLVDDPTGRLPVASSATEAAGTPHYMAPEMLLGEPDKLSVRSDVYLLGAILYEIFVGKPPHEGGDLNALVTHILVSPVTFPDSVPEEVQEICAKAMSREPERRFESAEAFHRAVDEFVRHRGSRRLAAEAKGSHALLRQTLAGAADAGSEDARAHEVARLLGECRFGYRAALTAWPENADARAGLDAALLSVVEHALATGDTGTSETLLHEVTDKPAGVAARVASAVQARAAHDDRLHRLEADLDTSVGTRTRTFVGFAFGLLWTGSPLAAWWYARAHGSDPPLTSAIAPLVFLLLGAGAFLWARESLTKTALNRRLVSTGAVYLTGQTMLGFGGYAAGLAPYHVHLASIFGWALTYSLLAVWAERRFAFVAATCAVSFLLAAVAPRLMFPLMSLDNFVFTVLVVRVWLPRDDIAKLRQRGRKLMLDR